MAQQNTTPIKEKIVLILKRRGPSLPVHISTEIGQSILFASAFLGELLSNKEVKISNLKVGSSPIYYLPGQEYSLEKFAQHLKSKERDAYELLKKEKFLKDIDQQPAIRVALRSIRDFAIPFKKQEEIYWRYFTIPESEFKIPEKPETKSKEEPVPQEPEPPQKNTLFQKITALTSSKPKEEHQKQSEKEEEKLDIFDEPQQETKPKKTLVKKSKTIKKTSKTNEKFFNKVKEFLTKNQREITDIVGFSKDEIFLKIKGEETLLVAYNKKRIDEKDILKAHKKAQELRLSYKILSLGEPPKKIMNFIGAIKDLDSLKKIE